MASEHAGPTSIAAYQLLDEIGRGGMGVVHRARDLRLDREVTVTPNRFEFKREDG